MDTNFVIHFAIYLHLLMQSKNCGYEEQQKFVYTCMQVCVENEGKNIYRNKTFSGLGFTNAPLLIQVK